MVAAFHRAWTPLRHQNCSEGLRNAPGRQDPKGDGEETPEAEGLEDMGARSVLVLESGDLSLSNHWVIADAAKFVLHGRSDRPDEVWLVDTTIPAEWTVICLIRDDVVFPDDETTNRYWQYDPANLEAV